MEVVKANKSDLSAILELQKLCYYENAARYNDFNIPPLTQTHEEIESEYLNNIFLKIEYNNNIIASVRAYEKERSCFIGRVIVHPEYQNKGLGKKLMDGIEANFNTQRFELFTGFRDEKNLYFYNKLGYKQYKEEKLTKDISLIYLEKINIS